MKEEDLNKREEKEKNSACPELLGFKRLTIDLSEVEPYEIGSLSPSNERVRFHFISPPPSHQFIPTLLATTHSHSCINFIVDIRFKA